MALLAAVGLAGSAFAVPVATYNAAQHDANGFEFGDFDDAFFGSFSTADGLISLDINDFNNDGDFFGGAGSDIFTSFDTNTTSLDVTFRVGPDNLASAFRVTLKDGDGLDTDGVTPLADEHVFEFDLTSLSPVDGFVTVSTPLNLGPLFTQGAFGGNPGDALQNYGLEQVQVQSVFGENQRLQIDIQQVQLVDSAATLLVELTPDTFATQTQSFDFGTFQEAGVVDQSGGTFVIDTSQAADPLLPGGLGFNGLNIDFEATEYAIEVEAKLLASNAAERFNVLMGDVDGDDSGPGLGSEEVLFSVATDQLNSTDFTTVTIPLGPGTESGFNTAFGSINEGDGVQNFGLNQLQIQVDEDNGLGALGVEIARFSIVPFTPTAFEGDFNDDGRVDNTDLNLLLNNWGSDTVPAEWVNNFDGNVDNNELNALLNSWGSGIPAPVPEPGSLLLGAPALLLLRRRR
ncbi:MAG: hypothetical protein AAFV43_13135 [Planctomycetota bacterium]